ncbi:hypothetical protein J1605_004906 [Eschrichtius robustus]|uniref:Uncharacterized protein n=1 Tax=Eschrichtius robustus TaxID=9764 RepID=A0AB34HDE0_ESCRO|nr:hypothetical protein J1605_004906 [Eschrichtius robustus]
MRKGREELSSRMPYEASTPDAAASIVNAQASQSRRAVPATTSDPAGAPSTTAQSLDFSARNWVEGGGGLALTRGPPLRYARDKCGVLGASGAGRGCAGQARGRDSRAGRAAGPDSPCRSAPALAFSSPRAPAMTGSLFKGNFWVSRRGKRPIAGLGNGGSEGSRGRLPRAPGQNPRGGTAAGPSLRLPQPAARPRVPGIRFPGSPSAARAPGHC